jgi:glutamyl-tRNA synthetase
MTFDAEKIGAADFKTLGPLVADLDKHLTLRTYLNGYSLSQDDEKVWTALRTNKVAIGLVRKGAYTNVTRWFKLIEEAHPELNQKLNAGKEKRAGGANYNIGLSNTENGVVTRFPPEPR